MKKKRLTALCLALTAILLFSACGSAAASVPAAEPEASNSEQAASQPVPAPEPAEEVPAEEPEAETSLLEEPEPEPEPEPDYFPVQTDEVVTMFATTSPVFSEYYDTIEEIKLYNWLEEKTGVDLEVNLISIIASFEQASLMIASGDMSDIMFDFGLFYTTGVSAAVEDEVIYDLAPHLDDYMPDYAGILDLDPSYRKDSTTLNGEHPLIQMIKSIDSPSEYGAVIRQDWLDQLGLDAPTTYDEWHDVLTAFRDSLGGSLWLPNTATIQDDILSAGYGVTSNINISGANYIVENDIVKYSMFEDGMLDYVTMLNTWYNENLLGQDFISYNEYKNPELDELNRVNAGIWFCAEGMIDTYATVGYDLSGLQTPSIERGEITHLYNPSNTVKSGAAITTCCDNLELVMRMFNLLFTEEGIMMYNYGTEGLTYTLDADGNPQFTDLIMNNPDGWNLETCLTYYCVYNQPGYCLYDRTKAGMSDISIAVIDAWGQNTDNAMRMSGSNFLTTEEATESANIYSDIETLVEESFVKFVVGELALSEWDDFIAQIEGMNINRVIELAQISYDRSQETLKN